MKSMFLISGRLLTLTLAYRTDGGPVDKPKDRERSSRFRRSRHGAQAGDKPSRSPSPGGAGRSEKLGVPYLLSLCISVLSSIISDDCRFQLRSHRPSRPPNSLQVVTLNVAQFLITTHRNTPQVVSQIGFAIIPAFSTFPKEMFGRLMIFFQDVVICGLLETLRQSQQIIKHDQSVNLMSPVGTPYASFFQSRHLSCFQKQASATDLSCKSKLTKFIVISMTQCVTWSKSNPATPPTNLPLCTICHLWSPHYSLPFWNPST